MHNLGIIGASSNIGKTLVKQCIEKNLNLNLFEHKTSLSMFYNKATIFNDLTGFFEKSNCIISLIQIWQLQDLLLKIKKDLNIKKIIIISSISASTKINSENNWERNYALKFLNSEKVIEDLCHEKKIECFILRPSMIWGNGKDLNISFLMKFISKYGFLVLPSKGKGIRHPIHVNQLSESILSFLDKNKGGLFNILGPEELTYFLMCKRIFGWYEFDPVIFVVPKFTQSLILFFAKNIFRKPYINRDSFLRIDYSPEINNQNPINLYAKGEFAPFDKEDLLKINLSSQFFNKFFRIVKLFIYINYNS